MVVVCDVHTLRQTPRSLLSGTQSLVIYLLFVYGWNLWLLYNKLNILKMAGCHLCDHITYDYNAFLFLVLRKTNAILGRPKWKGTEGRQSRNRVFLTVHEELNVAINHVSNDIDPFPVKHQMWLQPWQLYWNLAGDMGCNLARLRVDSRLRETEKINMCCCKVLNLWQNCYIAIDNWYINVDLINKMFESHGYVVLRVKRVWGRRDKE